LKKGPKLIIIGIVILIIGIFIGIISSIMSTSVGFSFFVFIVGIIILIVGIIVGVVKGFRESREENYENQQKEVYHQREVEEDDNPLDILKKRFANGEISKEEFDNIKKDLT